MQMNGVLTSHLSTPKKLTPVPIFGLDFVVKTKIPAPDGKLTSPLQPVVSHFTELFWPIV